MHQRRRRTLRTAGFTLIELLVTMIIIVVLAGILIPTVTHVRIAAQEASTRNQLNSISAAIERFHAENHRYPGFPDAWVSANLKGNQAPPIFPNLRNADKITQSEAMFVCLEGGVKWVTPQNAPSYLEFDSGLVGKGSVGSFSSPGKAKLQPYIEYIPTQSSMRNIGALGLVGKYSDQAAPDNGSGGGGADDSDLPEFVDSFANPMPFIYAPARVGVSGVVEDDTANNLARAQYVLSDFLPYTKNNAAGQSIGVGKRVKRSDYTTAPPANQFPHGLQTVNNTMSINQKESTVDGVPLNYTFPYDLYAYLVSSSTPRYSVQQTGDRNVPKGKDTFILISAGKDRVYGTEDDICSFGNLK